MTSKHTRSVVSKTTEASPLQTPKQPADSQALTAEQFKKEMAEMLKTQEQIFDKKFERVSEKVAEKVTDEMLVLKRDIDDQNEKLRGDIALMFQGLAAKIIKMEEDVEKVDNKVIEVQTKVGNLDDEMLLLQYRQMEFGLRVRGLKENHNEDLLKIFAEIFAQELNQQPDEIVLAIDKIYRVNSWVARQRNLPRDIVIYFTTRRLRNDILQIYYDKKCEVDGKEILFLKELPPKMLKNRKEFSFLINELKQRQIQFRWEVPTGLALTYQGRRYRLNTIWKARDFFENVLKAGPPHTSPSQQQPEEKTELTAEGFTESDLQQLKAVEAINLEKFYALSEPIGPKDQRQTRLTTKRKENELKLQIEKPKEAVGGAGARGDPQATDAMLLKLQLPKNGK